MPLVHVCLFMFQLGLIVELKFLLTPTVSESSKTAKSLIATHPKRVSFRLSLVTYTAKSTARAMATAMAMTTYHQCQENAGGLNIPSHRRRERNSDLKCPECQCKLDCIEETGKHACKCVALFGKPASCLLRQDLKAS